MEPKPQISYKTALETKFEKDDFYLEQLFTSCMAQYAYYIESNGEAVIIDPMREVDPYLTILGKRKSTLKYIFETHFHADFVSGHCELSKKTNAEIVFGPKAEAKFKFIEAKDNQVSLKVMHTPGHTLESSSFILQDSKGSPFAVFTGDTVFLGDVGRPDLATTPNITKEDLASMLFDSIQKVKALPDDTIIFPGHGAGSPCGKNIGKGHNCTIGKQKVNNIYMKSDVIKEKFISELTQFIPKAPETFFYDAGLNKSGPSDLDGIVVQGTTPLDFEKFNQAIKKGAIILDIRTIPQYLNTGYIKDSLYIDIEVTIGIWSAQLFKPQNEYVLVCEGDKVKEIVTRLARVGFEKVVGFLQGGIEEWVKKGGKAEKHECVTPEEMKQILEKDKAFVLDVRKPGEHNTMRVENAFNFELGIIEESYDKFPKDQDQIYVHCRSGSRSLMSIAILRRLGYSKKLINIIGGIEGLDKIGAKLFKA